MSEREKLIPVGGQIMQGVEGSVRSLDIALRRIGNNWKISDKGGA